MTGADTPDTARPGVACDFDGTLAAIVDDPAQARPVPGAVDALCALREAGARVLVVSGRPLGFLRAHLPDVVDLAGLYGIEQRIGGVVSVHPDVAAWEPVVREAVVACRQRLARSGARVEDKGRSLTVHWREAPEAAHVAGIVAAEVAATTGLELRAARASVELHPPVPIDKGRAVLDHLTGCDPVVMVGDDRGDLAAFAALDELARRGRHTLRVAVASPEAPPELLDAADEVVDGPANAVEWLARFAAGLSRRP